MQPIVTSEDMKTIPIRTQDGRQVQLQDVADLVRGHQPLIGDAVINEGDGLMLIVEKLPWANTMDVTPGVEQALAEMRRVYRGRGRLLHLPAATFIEDSIDNLTRALIIGALLMIFMLGAFLYSWRTAVISVVAIPLSCSPPCWCSAPRTTINTMILRLRHRPRRHRRRCHHRHRERGEGACGSRCRGREAVHRAGDPGRLDGGAGAIVAA